MFFDHAVLDALTRGAVLSVIGLFWIILLVRLVGLRSFSKMTNFDFVMTVAMGSLLAGAAQTTAWPGLLQTLTAMACLFVVQYGVSMIRQRSDNVQRALQNQPVLLMEDGQMLTEAMRATRVTTDDLMAKLREANALNLSEVRAVVLETTGDVSVLHGDQIDPVLIAKVRRIS